MEYPTLTAAVTVSYVAMDAVHDVGVTSFHAATGRKHAHTEPNELPPSDTNGERPAEVTRQLFSTLGDGMNGIDPP
jgi:hypothetical protein